MVIRHVLLGLIPFALTLVIGIVFVNVMSFQETAHNYDLVLETEKALSDSNRLTDEVGDCQSIESETLSTINKLKYEREVLLKEILRGNEVQSVEQKLIKLERNIAQLEDYLNYYEHKSGSKPNGLTHDLLYRTKCDNF